MTPRHAGVLLELDGTPHTLPPLTLGGIEEFEARLAQCGGTPTPALVIDMLLRALRRNYPALTREQVADGVDLRGMGQAWGALMGVSGLNERAEADAGKAPATMPGTGAPSMPTSPPVSAGASSTAASTSP